MSANPLVSIVIAVKNREQFIARALRSVEAQSWPQLEIIVVDGRSTDGTRAIAQTFPRVRWGTQEGVGLSDAWNFGVQRARGEWICFLDSDDWWPEDKLELQMKYLAAHPDIDYCIGHVRFLLEAGHAVPAGFKRELLEGTHIGRIPGTLAARRSLFDRVGLFKTELAIAADVDWFVRALDLAVPLGFLDDTLLYKSVHSANLSSHAQQNTEELMRVLRSSLRRREVGSS